MSLRAASSLGKCPFVLIALRSCRFNASIAFVVYTTRRSSDGNARNGVTYSHAFSHACVITGKREPHFSSKCSSAAWAAPAGASAPPPPARRRRDHRDRRAANRRRQGPHRRGSKTPFFPTLLSKI